MPIDLQPALNPADRAIPPCPHFGPCGGCQLQHLTYAAQLGSKAERLHALLEPTAIELPKLQLHPSPPLAYRSRIRLSLTEVDGHLRAGYIRSDANDTRSILPITQCPISAPVLWRTAEAFLVAANRSPNIWLRNPQQLPDQLELFTTADESRIQLTLYLRTQAKVASATLATAFTVLCDDLRIHTPELTAAGIALLPPASAERSRRTELPRPATTWGSPGLNYRVGEIDYWVPRTAFFQANRFLLPELLRLVSANRSGTLAWDLYAGVGLFSRALTRTFTQVTAVEIAEPAATALASTKLRNLNAVKATTLDFLRASVIQRERPELIVLDPPRTGAGAEICNLLTRVAASSIIYVSCSPQHLAADLIPLTASGYTVAALHLVDLFPQTTHIETVAVLTR